MRLQFLNRAREVARLGRALNAADPALIVVYGRRRCGKSRLLQHIARKQDIYYLADQQEAPLQIKGLAAEIGRHVPGFDQVAYPSWEVLFNALYNQARHDIALILDEFPYLVQKSPELPSILQRHIDTQKNTIHLIICGSSQRMMQGLVLDSTAPLYGRAAEIIKLRPLEPGWLADALECDAVQTVEAYSIWGGVPRYWELAKQYSSTETACKELVLDRDGILHEEPMRLLLDDMRGASQPHSLLGLIAGGAHRLSEIAGRLGKPSTSLTRPLANLIQLGYIKKEVPFGENIRSGKKTLYRLADPFLQFWYRIVMPNQSLLEQDLIDAVYAASQQTLTMQVADVWEELARWSVPRLAIAGQRWKPAARWWGKGLNGNQMEIDLVAESLDGCSLLFGEAKWEKKTDVRQTLHRLTNSAENFPKIGKRKIVLALWCKNPAESPEDTAVFNAADVMAVLR
ncbi:ATPase [Desulfolithobacter dissulfuricans]|uniref:ATPase n=1 Tax=Desulfolithobacter dissulfuricans TaxID=2795293 RepID=A0A915U1M6_9BACT|nr:ATP-binding protein [Desulfolithobacter dissulfuricans]BCO09753.1 ATPase [Desulfolithobacter dissulfuricans]